MALTAHVPATTQPPVTLPNRAMVHVEEIAAATGVCVHTIYRWLKDKTIPGARKVGRRYMVPRAMVAEFLGLNSEIPARA